MSNVYSKKKGCKTENPILRREQKVYLKIYSDPEELICPMLCKLF